MSQEENRPRDQKISKEMLAALKAGLEKKPEEKKQEGQGPNFPMMNFPMPNMPMPPNMGFNMPMMDKKAQEQMMKKGGFWMMPPPPFINNNQKNQFPQQMMQMPIPMSMQPPRPYTQQKDSSAKQAIQDMKSMGFQYPPQRAAKGSGGGKYGEERRGGYQPFQYQKKYRPQPRQEKFQYSYPLRQDKEDYFGRDTKKIFSRVQVDGQSIPRQPSYTYFRNPPQPTRSPGSITRSRGDEQYRYMRSPDLNTSGQRMNRFRYTTDFHKQQNIYLNTNNLNNSYLNYEKQTSPGRYKYYQHNLYSDRSRPLFDMRKSIVRGKSRRDLERVDQAYQRNKSYDNLRRRMFN